MPATMSSADGARIGTIVGGGGTHRGPQSPDLRDRRRSDARLRMHVVRIPPAYRRYRRRMRRKAAFVPALANSFAKRVAEIRVDHSERAEGQSKYNLLRLATLSLNLITGYSLLPIQALSLTGIVFFLIAAAFSLFLFAHRLIFGPQQEGAIWVLLAVLFLFVGLLFLGLGLIGEYVGRIYIEVRRRPTYIVRKVHGSDHAPNAD